MIKLLERQSPARIISFGFASLILLGSVLLILPCSLKDGVTLRYIDSLYTSASAVCVTGLVTVDVGNTFSTLGQIFLAVLIQMGGLGVALVGAGIILAVGRKVNLKGRIIIRETMNLNSGKGMVRLVHRVFAVTLIFEFTGALLSFFVLIRDYPFLKAVGISLFHSVAAFNNSGFDIFGNYQSLSAYENNAFFILITCVLIFFGGIGFLVICELQNKRFRWKKLSMHSKVVLSVSGALIVLGTLLFKLSENMPWLDALFYSISARTAGFATYPLKNFSYPGLLVMMILMFIGASSGSTGGGIKTSTFFVLLCAIKSAATNQSEKAFHYAVPRAAFRKAAIIALLAIGVIITGTYIMCMLEPAVSMVDILFEITSAFGTVGLSTGITPNLSIGSKLLSVLIMYIGRLGPLTVASIWQFSKGERVSYPDGNISIG